MTPVTAPQFCYSVPTSRLEVFFWGEIWVGCGHHLAGHSLYGGGSMRSFPQCFQNPLVTPCTYTRGSSCFSFPSLPSPESFKNQDVRECFTISNSQTLNFNQGSLNGWMMNEWVSEWMNAWQEQFGIREKQLHWWLYITVTCPFVRSLRSPLPSQRTATWSPQMLREATVP